MEKKITKEDYLRKKGILPQKNLGSIYFFKSDREGVSNIKESLIWDQSSSKGYFYQGKIKQDYTRQKYFLKEEPYEIKIIDGEIVGQENLYGSGVGDLWGYSYFGSLDKMALEEAREKEKQRIEEKYGN